MKICANQSSLKNNYVAVYDIIICRENRRNNNNTYYNNVHIITAVSNDSMCVIPYNKLHFMR